MSRRKAREMALQTLFQLDFDRVDHQGALETVFAEHPDVGTSAKQYAKLLVEGTAKHFDEINSIISSLSAEWKLDRMAGVDRNIVRLALFEMKFGDEEIPPNVIINEAVELAKTFGSDDSGRFVNGLLGALVKNKAQS